MTFPTLSLTSFLKTVLSTVYNLAPHNHTSLYCLDSWAEHSESRDRTAPDFKHK